MRILFFALVGLILSPLATQASSPADSVQQCALFDYAQWRRERPRPAGKQLDNLNVGEPRTVRMIYFLPNDRPYRAEAVDTMKTRIRQAQDFFGRQMAAHGLGNLTFRFETDARGEPLVHRVNGQHSNRYYANDANRYYNPRGEVFHEIDRAFDLEANVYYIAIDNGDDVLYSGPRGIGNRTTKNGGFALVTISASLALVAHELGHAFGLWHDFRDDEYIMSYGGLRRNSLSMCNAEFLAVHPYFNPNSPIAGQSSPAIAERTASPIRIAGATSIPLRIKTRDPDGLHQAILFTRTQAPHYAEGSLEVKACRGLEGKGDAVVEFAYDGVVPSAKGSDFSSFQTQGLRIEVIDALGNVADPGEFRLFGSPFVRRWAGPVTLTKVSGDGQEWLVGAQLAQPFVVSVLDQYGSPFAGAVVAFSVTAGGGTLSATSATTDANGRARSTLTLGREPGTNTVKATVVETTFRPVTFTATASEQIPHRLTKVFGDGQEGLAGTQLARPFVVSVLDQDSTAMAGVIVAFSVTAGEGTLSATSATTDANGRARSTLTLGRELGTNTVEVTVKGLKPATFTATASGQMPHTLTKISGDGQEGPASTQLDEPFVVSVLDQEGSALAGAVVRFSVTAGEGMLSSPTDANPCTVGAATASTTITTDANGQAAIRLTLGRKPGANVVAATVEGLKQATFTAAAAEPARPHKLTKVCGDNQEGPAGTQLTQPLVVLVSDEKGAARAGVAVTFSVTAGEGTLSATTATTDANGRAACWLTLDLEPGTNTVEATVTGLNPVTFAATGQESLLSMFLSGQLGTLPNRTHLLQNAPNPFNSQTMLSYFLHTPGPVRLEVFTLAGQRIAVLHQGPQSAGYHRLSWDSRDAAGQPVASGLYLYRLVTDEGVLTRKLILLR